MAHVITNDCEKCVACVEACPTDAIHPRNDESDFDSVSQLFINPTACIDCGACVAVCPSNAIFADSDLPAEKAEFVKINEAHFE